MAINTSTLTLTAERHRTRPLLRYSTLPHLLTFIILAIAAIGYRRRPDVYKWLMLFANISLMAAPIAHAAGHIPGLSPSQASFAIPCTLFRVAPVAFDSVTEKSVRFLPLRNVEMIVRLARGCSIVGCPSYCDT